MIRLFQHYKTLQIEEISPDEARNVEGIHQNEECCTPWIVISVPRSGPLFNHSEIVSNCACFHSYIIILCYMTTNTK
jgi:hypothetical protein